MTSIRVRAEQTTVDWERGSEFDIERTPFVDRLISSGGLTAIGSDPAPESNPSAGTPGPPVAADGDVAAEDTPEPESGEPDKPSPRRRRTAKDDDA